MLVISPFPDEAAGTRFRISQYIPYLQAHGFEITVDALYTRSFFRFVYRKGHYVRKAVTLAGLALRRFAAMTRAGRYDLIFIYREAFPIGPPFLERRLASLGPAMVLDFDDAFYLNAAENASEANRLLSSLKNAEKVPVIISLSDHVIVGNEHLARYALAHNTAVTTIPTCVDTLRFVPRTARGQANPPLVGWIGSPTTTPYLSGLSDVLRKVREQHAFELRVSGANELPRISGVTVHEEPWSLDREVELFNTCDVGVYPLTDDEWARGKCGFKAIQFMACGVPVVASAVGVNREIIQDGVNGFLASTPAEWVEKLGRLLSDAALRETFSAAGRQTVEARYSLRVQAPRLAATLRDAVGAREAAKRTA